MLPLTGYKELSEGGDEPSCVHLWDCKYKMDDVTDSESEENNDLYNVMEMISPCVCVCVCLCVHIVFLVSFRAKRSSSSFRRIS